jgi:hypothetical protein
MATFSNLKFVPFFRTFLSCVCVFSYENKKTSRANRFVLSSADGHDAKTLRVHQRVVANDLNVVFPYEMLSCTHTQHSVCVTDQTNAQSENKKTRSKKQWSGIVRP